MLQHALDFDSFTRLFDSTPQLVAQCSVAYDGVGQGQGQGQGQTPSTPYPGTCALLLHVTVTECAFSLLHMNFNQLSDQVDSKPLH